MSKRKRGFTREKYQKWIKEGRGQGEGASYKPWLTIQDVPSQGKSSRFVGIKTGRQHEVFSQHELNYLLSVEFSNDVIDIREQYPILPVEETIDMAQELGIKHPTDPSTQEEFVITTDFLITTINHHNVRKLFARTIKECNDLNDQRQMDKFEIERRCWAKRGIDWGIVTERKINRILAQNIELVYQFYELKKLRGFETLSFEQISNITNLFKDEIIGDTVIREKAHEFEKRMILEKGCGISIFKHFIITKQIHINMFEPVNIDKPICIKL